MTPPTGWTVVTTATNSMSVRGAVKSALKARAKSLLEPGGAIVGGVVGGLALGPPGVAAGAIEGYVTVVSRSLNDVMGF